MIGKTYLERGSPVTVMARWGQHAARIDGPFGRVDGQALRGGPRNVLIQRSCGALIVRPFRGLRKMPDPAPAPARTRGRTIVVEPACPRAGKWIGGCRFEGRYDLGYPSLARVKVCPPEDLAEIITATKPKIYVRDVCTRCGRTIERQQPQESTP